MKVFDIVWDLIWDFFVGDHTTLHTPLNKMNDDDVRKIVTLGKEWCIEKFGVNNRRSLKVYMKPQTSGELCYGVYNADHNTITLHDNNCEDVKCLIKTLIHEYTHHLQPVKNSYKKLLNEYGYRNHPMEIEARKMEGYYIDLWMDIKDKL
jgi:hypothetical protein